MSTIVNNFYGINGLNLKAQKFIISSVNMNLFYTFLTMLSNTYIILFALVHVSLSQLGILLGIQFAVQALTDYPTGALADYIGQRWVMFIAGIFYSFGFLILANSVTYSNFIIAFAIIGFARGQDSGTFNSWFENNYKIAAKEDQDRRIYGLVFGKFTMMREVIIAIAIIIGGILLIFISRENLFLIQGCILLFFSFSFIYLMRDLKEKKKESIEFGKYLKYLREGVIVVSSHKKLRLLIIGLVISGSGFALFAGLLLFPLYLEYGRTDNWIAFLRAIIFIASAIMTGLMSNISKKIGSIRKWLSLAIIATDLTFFFSVYLLIKYHEITNFALGLIVIIAVFSFAYIPRYLADILKPRFFMDVIPDRNRNSIYSLIPTLVLISSIFYTMIGGIMLNQLGREVVFIFLMINGLIGSGLTAFAMYTFGDKDSKTQPIVTAFEERALRCC